MDVKIFANVIEEKAKQQICAMAKLSAFAGSKIRIMPDVHSGAGCVIGFTADLGDKVIPNVVGVDIGCGMHVVELGNYVPDEQQLADFDNYVKQHVPSGFSVYNNSSPVAESLIKACCCFDSFVNVPRLVRSLGTLGGGNHFIELDIDEDASLYLVIHTGSRNFGKQVADIYQKIANKECNPNDNSDIIKQMQKEGRSSEIQEYLSSLKKEFVPKEFRYLTGDSREDYLHDMRLCQSFAVKSRNKIAEILISYLHTHWGVSVRDEWESVHNYIDDNNIVRKGAICAAEGVKCIIPLNMRDGSVIAIGKGNADWNNSAPHGAGRIMSRSAAKSSLQEEHFIAEMKEASIFTTTANKDTIDEAPEAYKKKEDILSVIGDTVSVSTVIKPVYNFKACE